jgi:phosphopantothenoylcysteine synthetase/decarboxylase
MNKKIYMSIIALFVLIFIFYDQLDTQQNQYKFSNIQKDFPVPLEAKLTNVTISNKNIKKAEKYLIKGLTNRTSTGKLSNYKEKINEHGWKDLIDENEGNKKYVFIKNDNKVWIIVHENTFTLCIIK